MCLGSGRPTKQPVKRSLSFFLSAADDDAITRGKYDCMVDGSNRESKPNSFLHSNGSCGSQAMRVRVCGYEVDKPSSVATASTFFPILSSKYSKTRSGQKPPIAVVIPCYNEEAHSLDRTIKSFKEQVLPPGIRLELVIVMDGFTKVSESMKAYLKELFLVDVDIFHAISEDVKTIIVEPEDESHDVRGHVGLSLVIKRHNKGKLDSQRWWMGAQAPAVRCDYVFQTDCGMMFDAHCVRLMYEQMELDPNVAGACCRQRTMAAEQQGEAPGEFWRQPSNAVLRLLQQFDMEDVVPPTRLFNNMIGYLGVFPGSGGIYRYKHLGSLDEGPIKDYFNILAGESGNEGIMLGNIRLAEDRVLPSLVTFQSTEACSERSVLPRPRLSFLPDAVSYCEAEYPLPNLVKQRRRWCNGALFRGLWLLSTRREYNELGGCCVAFRAAKKNLFVSQIPASLPTAENIVESGHSVLFKITAFSFLTIDVLQRLIYAVVTVPFIATVIYATTKLLVNVGGTSNDEDMLSIVCSSDLPSVAIGLLPALAYLAFYAYFIVQHTPRAKPELVKCKETAKKVRWCLDKDTAYRTTLWNMHNAIHVGLHFVLLATLFCYGMLGAAVHAIFIAHMTFSVIEAFFWFLVYGKIRTMKLLVHLLAFPLLMCGITGTRHVWFPSYCLVRVPDCSWGNRGGSYESGSQQAKRAEHVGKQIRFVLFASNLVAFMFIMLRLHSGVDIFLLTEQRFDLLFVVNSLDPFAALPLSGVGIALKRLFILWIVAVMLEVKVETNQKGSGRVSSGPIFNSKWTENAKSWKFSLLQDLLHPVLNGSKEKKD